MQVSKRRQVATALGLMVNDAEMMMMMKAGKDYDGLWMRSGAIQEAAC